MGSAAEPQPSTRIAHSGPLSHAGRLGGGRLCAGPRAEPRDMLRGQEEGAYLPPASEDREPGPAAQRPSHGPGITASGSNSLGWLTLRNNQL